MRMKSGWFVVLVALALLVAACGPQMATPTADVPDETGDTQKGDTATAETSTGGETEQEEPATGELPVDSDDWHVLGAPDAPVTIVEYADFQ
ncbi:MAG: hypothetical protein PVJ26_00435 [Anaerolineae bacterium]